MSRKKFCLVRRLQFTKMSIIDEESDITYHVESYQAIKAGEERLLFFKEKNIM